MTEDKEKLISRIITFFRNNLMIMGEVCAVIVAAVASILGLVNIWDAQIVISVFCALIAFLIFYFITQHKNISKIQSDLSSRFDVMEEKVCASTNPNLDGLFYQNNELHESEIISQAKNQLVLVQETGNLIIERNKDTLRKFLQNGGKLTIVVCANEKTTQSYLAYRSEDLRSGTEINIRLQSFLNQIQSTVEPGHIGNKDFTLKKGVTLRYCPYPVGITAVYSPDKHIEAAVIRHSDFKVSYQNKISLFVEKKNFPRIYTHYQQQIASYFLCAYKKVLITGQPHIGKTTLIKELLNRFAIDQSMPIYYFYTEEIMRNGKRTGYQVFSSTRLVPSVLATKNESVSPLQYDVDISLLNSIADELIDHQQSIIVIDEIGLMQMRSQKFRETIFKIIDNPNCVLIGTVSQDSAGDIALENIKSHLMTECIEYSRDNHDFLLNRLVNELASALNMYPLVKE